MGLQRRVGARPPRFPLTEKQLKRINKKADSKAGWAALRTISGMNARQMGKIKSKKIFSHLRQKYVSKALDRIQLGNKNRRAKVHKLVAESMSRGLTKESHLKLIKDLTLEFSSKEMARHFVLYVTTGIFENLRKFEN